VKYPAINSQIKNIIKRRPAMKITVAGEKKEYEEGISVAKLIELENVETPQYVTVSLNEEFIDSGAFDTTILKEGDEVEFLYFMGGGR
jgi:sulfur carrier protein